MLFKIEKLIKMERFEEVCELTEKLQKYAKKFGLYDLKYEAELL